MGADSLAKNTPNASINFSPICLLKPKSLGFLKKALSGCPWSVIVSYKNWSFAKLLSYFFVSFSRERKSERIEIFFHKIRILVVPLLKTLYSADERNNHHTYMSLIILLILSEDEFFNGMYLFFFFLHIVIDNMYQSQM